VNAIDFCFLCLGFDKLIRGNAPFCEAMLGAMMPLQRFARARDTGPRVTSGTLNDKETETSALSSISVESGLQGAPGINLLNDAWTLLRARSSLGPARCARRYGIRGSGSNNGANV
jgi:hypothetical protein